MKKIEDALYFLNKALIIIEYLKLEYSFRIQITSECNYLKGKALMELNLYKESIIFFKRAISIKPDEAVFHNIKGLCYLKMNDCESAMESFTKASQIEPENEAYFYNITLAKNKKIAKKFSMKSFMRGKFSFF
jgi:tetratricopeptide (TPR) repeat protein